VEQFVTRLWLSRAKKKEYKNESGCVCCLQHFAPTKQSSWEGALFVVMGVSSDLLVLASLPSDVDGYISICGYGSLLSGN